VPFRNPSIHTGVVLNLTAPSFNPACRRTSVRCVSVLSYLIVISRSWGSSVSIVSNYTLDDLGLIPAEAKNFSCSLFVQTSSEVHSPSYPIGTGVLS
jgi:hypothetical protein